MFQKKQSSDNNAYVTSEAITNSDVRIAFGLDEKEKVKASRMIRDTLELKSIKPVDSMIAFAYNVNKLHAEIQQKRTGMQLLKK